MPERDPAQDICYPSCGSMPELQWPSMSQFQDEILTGTEFC